jgi:DME family drug/metabolite transporter
MGEPTISIEMRRAPRKGLWMVGLGSVFFGFTGVISKTLYGQSDITPVGVSWLRMFVAAIPMLLLVLARSGRVSRPRSLHDLFLMVGLGLSVGGYQVAFFSGVERSTVTTVTLLAICTAPVMVALLARVLLREQLNRMMVLALVCSIAGTALMVQSGGRVSLASEHLTGNLLGLAAAACYASFVLISKSALDWLDSFTILVIAFCVATLLLAPLAWADLRSAGLTASDWPYIMWLGLGATALAYTLLTAGLQYASATATSIATLIEPLTATLLAALLFQERLGKIGILGAVLLAVGMLFLYQHGS